MNLRSRSLQDLLDDLAGRTPVPGGGTVAGIIAALATSLGRMVLAFTQGKQAFAEYDEVNERSVAFLTAASDEALELAEADAAAYERLNTLWKLPDDDPQRDAGWDGAVEGAIDAPLRTMALCQRMLTAIAELRPRTSRMLASDLVIAAILAAAAARAASCNVATNLPHLRSEARRASLSAQSKELLAACNELAEQVESTPPV
jgi:formiminotetrahydrofolate cyclodeaminase